MSTAEIISGTIAFISLCISGYVAYKSLIQRFLGKIWLSQAIVLTHIDTTPSLGLACFLENKGVHSGYIEDIRLLVKHNKTATEYKFYPFLTRDDYSIFESYTAKDWFPFSGFYLLPNDKTNKYILFKPLNDQFIASNGDYHIDLEVKWENSKSWQKMPQKITIEISLEVEKIWSNPISPSFQVFSKNIIKNRMES